MTRLRQAASVIVLIVLSMTPIGGTQRASQSPASPAAAGWAAIEERRYSDALAAFTAAAGATKADSSLCTGAGFAAFMLGQDTEAQVWLERALTLVPQNTDASLLLGEVHHRSGRIVEAVATYEAALKHAPREAVLNEKLVQWRKDASVRANAYESRGAHFSVLFQGPADEMIARRSVELLEEAYWRVGSALSTYPTGTITVVLYTEEQFRDVTRSPAWAAGSYDGTIRIPTRGALDHPEELERILAHEFVHAVVATIGGRDVPAWLNEGLATLLEPDGGAEETSAAGATPIRLSRLERSFGRLTAEEAQIAYAQSTAAVRKVMQLRGTPAIVTLLEDLRRGVPFASAFYHRISMRYEDFQIMVERQ
ncbi:MAG: tetratricopeptide repeat protein [Acidobacteria bacterium]|nr:tetratricopeptide repeat protein [Acidobacteriota bacterium]